MPAAQRLEAGAGCRPRRLGDARSRPAVVDVAAGAVVCVRARRELLVAAHLWLTVHNTSARLGRVCLPDCQAEAQDLRQGASNANQHQCATSLLVRWPGALKADGRPRKHPRRPWDPDLTAHSSLTVTLRGGAAAGSQAQGQHLRFECPPACQHAGALPAARSSDKRRALAASAPFARVAVHGHGSVGGGRVGHQVGGGGGRVDAVCVGAAARLRVLPGGLGWQHLDKDVALGVDVPEGSGRQARAGERSRRARARAAASSTRHALPDNHVACCPLARAAASAGARWLPWPTQVARLRRRGIRHVAGRQQRAPCPGSRGRVHHTPGARGVAGEACVRGERRGRGGTRVGHRSSHPPHAPIWCWSGAWQGGQHTPFSLLSNNRGAAAGCWLGAALRVPRGTHGQPCAPNPPMTNMSNA